MMKKVLRVTAACALFTSVPVSAGTVLDASGDFLPTYTGPREGNLDVTSFSVDYDPIEMHFLFHAQLAGAVADPRTLAFYDIGINTGTGAMDPFDSIGQGDVTLDQVITVGPAGHSNLVPVMAWSTNNLWATIPLRNLPSTGFAPENYGFNIWVRTSGPTTDLQRISDFAPENALLSASVIRGAIPEPSAWAMLLLGFGAVGGAIRLANRRASARVGYA